MEYTNLLVLCSFLFLCFKYFDYLMFLTCYYLLLSITLMRVFMIRKLITLFFLKNIDIVIITCFQYSTECCAVYSILYAWFNQSSTKSRTPIISNFSSNNSCRTMSKSLHKSYNNITYIIPSFVSNRSQIALSKDNLV